MPPSIVKVKFTSGAEGAFDVPVLTIEEKQRTLEHLINYNTPAIVAACMRQNMVWVNSLDQDSYLELAARFGNEIFKMAMVVAGKDPIASIRLAPLFEKAQAIYRSLLADEEMMTVLKELISSGSKAGTISSPLPGAISSPSSVSSIAPQPAASIAATPTGSSS